MVPLVAAFVVSEPAVEVTALVQLVETIVSGLFSILDMLVCSPPHVGVALQGREPLQSSLVVDLLLQLVTVPETPVRVDGLGQERIGRHGGGGGEPQSCEWLVFVEERSEDITVRVPQHDTDDQEDFATHPDSPGH